MNENPFKSELVIVDNDSKENARPLIEATQSEFPQVSYSVEPEKNIALARTRAVERAKGEWVLFIDDDEVPEVGWLEAYWKIIDTHPADGYFGPVVPILEGEAPPWMKDDLLYRKKRFSTGTVLDFSKTSTANLCIRRELFLLHRFDPKFGRMGSSDTELFSRMIDGGATFLWCDEALVYEYIPAARQRIGWLFQRRFRGGLTYTKIQRMRLNSPLWSALNFFKALLGSFLLFVVTPFSIILGLEKALNSLLKLATQIGHVWAFLNLEYEEYK